MFLTLGTWTVGSWSPAHPAPGGRVGSPTPVALGPSTIAPALAVQPRAGFTLSEDGASPAAVGINWTQTGDIFFNNYTVWYSDTSSGGPWQGAAVLTTAASTTYVEQGLNPGATYWWQVVENGAFGASNSNVLSVTQPTLAFLTATQPTATSVRLNWTNNATYGGLISFVSYRIYDRVGTGSLSLIATLTDPTTLTDTLQGLSSGTSYGFQLNTTDCLGGCGGATPTLSVTSSNVVTVGTALPLSANIGVARGIVDVNQLDLLSCNPAGGRSPFTFSWDLGNGTYVPGSGTVSVDFSTAGVTTVTCLVTDAASTKVSAAASITVDKRPILTATVNRSAADAGESLAFSCGATLGTSPLLLNWVFGDGTGFAGGIQTHGYSAAGRYAASCTVVDQTGTTETTTLPIAVSPALTAAASSSAARAAPGTGLTFTGRAANGSGSYPAYLWNFGDGSIATGSSVSHTFVRTGDFSVSLRVNDTNGVAVVATTPVSVTNVTVHLGAAPASVTAGGSVAYTASASGGAGGPYNYSWSFGDGQVAFGPSVRHAFHSAGHYQPTVLVTDVLGGSNLSAAGPLTVMAPPPPPPSPVVYLVLLLAILVGVILAVAHHRRAWRVTGNELADSSGRVPPSDPSGLVQAPKICRFCGSPNVPIRTTCENCGRPLPR